MSDNAQVKALDLIVPRKSLAAWRSAIEQEGIRDRGVRISQCHLKKVQEHDGDEPPSQHMIIPTTVKLPLSFFQAASEDTNVAGPLILQILDEAGVKIPAGAEVTAAPRESTAPRRASRNPLAAAVTRWLDTDVNAATAHRLPPRAALLAATPRSFSAYGAMAVLPAGAFNAGVWAAAWACVGGDQQLVNGNHDNNDGDVGAESLRRCLYARIAAATRTTHVAAAGPIPRAANEARLPRAFTPLYGDFGPPAAAPAAPAPSAADFAAAFWVQARQNGLLQVWAPRHTMFSRGNVSEKARLLRDSGISCGSGSGIGRSDDRGWAAVDLYAGIGYFAFSYSAAGAAQVLCWEINPWSVEGLRRGAEANAWVPRTLSASTNAVPFDAAGFLGDARIVIFPESNVHARDRVGALRGRVAPIRHVNCGLLPSSMLSWPTAVAVLDPELGGWMHAHENLAVQNIEGRAKEVELEIQREYDRLYDCKGAATTSRVNLAHVERVKTYAPGVMHCVMDIWIPPKPAD